MQYKLRWRDASHCCSVQRTTPKKHWKREGVSPVLSTRCIDQSGASGVKAKSPKASNSGVQVRATVWAKSLLAATMPKRRGPQTCQYHLEVLVTNREATDTSFRSTYLIGRAPVLNRQRIRSFAVSPVWCCVLFLRLDLNSECFKIVVS